MRPLQPHVIASGLLSILAAAPLARAQCDERWLPGPTLRGVDGPVSAQLLWDPDGPGPQTPKLVIGGSFTIAGDQFIRNLALWDPLTLRWSSPGETPNGPVRALAALPDGRLAAGGDFTAVGSTQASHLATWDGAAWAPIGSGVDGPVHAIVAHPSGALIVGGAFANAGPLPAANIARWNGAAWSAFGLGMRGGDEQPAGMVRALALMPNGDLVAGGNFYSAGTTATYTLARWNGSRWNAFPGFNGAPHVSSLLVKPNGDLVVGGTFQYLEGLRTNGIALYNGRTWSTMGDGLVSDTSYSVDALALSPTGDVIAGGSFYYSGSTIVRGLARWTGASWSPVGDWLAGRNSTSRIAALTFLPDGSLVCGGELWFAGPASHTRNIARCVADAWQPISPGPDGRVLKLAAAPDGDLYAGGDFSLAPDGAPANRVARKHDGRWLPLGDGLNGYISTFTIDPDGALLVGGEFTASGAAPLPGRLARWDGAAWRPVGDPIPGITSIIAARTLPSGDVIAQARFPSPTLARVYRLPAGSNTWSVIGVLENVYSSVVHISAAPDGAPLIFGSFQRINNILTPKAARWDGAVWSTLGPPVPDELGNVDCGLDLLDGQILIAGYFTSFNGVPARNVVRWTGSAWAPVGDGFRFGALALARGPDGSLYAAGSPALPPDNETNIARWDGARWTSLNASAGGNELAFACAVTPDGDVHAGGTFLQMNGVLSVYSATLSARPDCPADLTCDRIIDAADYSAFLDAFEAGRPSGDFNADGFVDFFDYADFVLAFETGC